MFAEKWNPPKLSVRDSSSEREFVQIGLETFTCSADIKTVRAMNQILDCPVLGLDVDFPSRVFVIKHPPSGRYGCYCFDGIHGLACFSSGEAAMKFSGWLDLSGMEAEDVSFDQAREIAKARPALIVSLMLLDDMEDPEIHYVR